MNKIKEEIQNSNRKSFPVSLQWKKICKHKWIFKPLRKTEGKNGNPFLILNAGKHNNKKNEGEKIRMKEIIVDFCYS